MNAPARVSLQAAAWLALAALVGAFAQGPAYEPAPPGHGELKFSLAHLTERILPCRRLTEEERLALPPTRRAYEICERERAPAIIELRLDGELLMNETVRPAGWHRDGRSYLHQRWRLQAGEYALRIGLRDTPRESGFDRIEHLRLRLDPGVSVLVELGDGEAAWHPPSAVTREQSP